MNGVSISASRLNRTWRVGDPWSIAVASELYEIARWGALIKANNIVVN